MNQLSESNQKVSVLIAASGTGGHLFPGKYIAESLRKKSGDVDVYFVGSGRPLEEQIIDRAGYKRFVINTSGVRRLGIKGLIKWFCSLPAAVSQCREIFLKVKPSVVIGVGGYASFLPVLYSRFCGIPAWIHEAERTPGLANYLLSIIASGISVSFQKTKLMPFTKAFYSGHPIRPTIRKERFVKDPSAASKKILIMGGSQGSKNIDEAFINLSRILPKETASIPGGEIEIFHQCRTDNIELLRTAYDRQGIRARVTGFIEDIESLYDWCDLIVTRSGAGSVREIYVTGRPVVCIPLPGALEQLENANLLVNSGTGLLVMESDNREVFEANILRSIKEILNNYRNYYIKRESEELVYDELASERIAEKCLQLAATK